MTDTKTESEKIEKLGELIRDVNIAMLTTVDDDGRLRSRPMGYRHPKEGFDGTITFFTSADSGKADEVARVSEVNVSFADPKREDYVSVSGTARLSFNRAKMEMLWSPILEAWFPNGLEEPGIALLEITPEVAEYWTTPGGRVVSLIQIAKAVVTHHWPKNMSEHEKIDMSGATTASGSRETAAAGGL